MSCPVPDIIDSNPSPFIPTHPFAKAAGGDTILRSSDGADFYLHHAILSLVSPVFETMFSLPQAESSPAVPTIDLQEGSATLDRVLRFFYPAAQPNVATLEELQEVIEVLMKYDMQCVILMAKQHLEKYHSSRPLAVYAIACRHRWKDVAVAAARESLNHALRARLLADAPPDLEGVTAVAYHNLLQYHSRCGEAARSTTAQLRWFSWPTTLDYCRCNKTPVMFADDSYRQAPVWFSQYLTGVCDILTVVPGSNVRETGTFYTTLWQNKCDRCCQFNFIGFVTSQLPAQLKVEIDRVCGTHMLSPQNLNLFS